MLSILVHRLDCLDPSRALIYPSYPLNMNLHSPNQLELIDAFLGDEEGANVLRQQLLDAYQVEEEGEDADGR